MFRVSTGPGSLGDLVVVQVEAESVYWFFPFFSSQGSSRMSLGSFLRRSELFFLGPKQHPGGLALGIREAFVFCMV